MAIILGANTLYINFCLFKETPMYGAQRELIQLNLTHKQSNHNTAGLYCDTTAVLTEQYKRTFSEEFTRLRLRRNLTYSWFWWRRELFRWCRAGRQRLGLGYSVFVVRPTLPARLTGAPPRHTLCSKESQSHSHAVLSAAKLMETSELA